MLGLCERCWGGGWLRPGGCVISADEQAQLQALLRRHALVAPARGRCGLVGHGYGRRGTLADVAAIDVHGRRRGVFGCCEPRISSDAFDALVADVMTSEPYASARRVFWIVDNGTIHRGRKAIERLQGAWPKLVLVHLAKRVSWLNQIEILARKALTSCHFASLDELAERVLGFQAEFP